MSRPVGRGDGVGIEIADTVIRGVRLRHDVNGRLAAAAEFPVNLADDNSTLDALVLLRAELGDPDEPARIATFPEGAMLQRIDITGRSGPNLNELRSKLDRLHRINSTVVIEDGPRRWLLLIRWDAQAVRRIEDLAERAGFIDVTIEPSPLALARVAGPDATFVRRFVAQGDAHRMVVRNRLPVAAVGAIAVGHPHPRVEISSVDVSLAYFDDFMTDPALGEIIDRIDERATTTTDSAPDALDPSHDDPEPAGRDPAADVELQLVDVAYPNFPAHDQRSAQRQGVALGAAVGAAGLAGPLRPVDMIISSVAVDDQFDRPWAIEELSPLPAYEPGSGTSGPKRFTRYLRPRSRR
ncbi:MAG: hypothetical protein ABJH68_15985 [Ilumatobacter sp.]|uniref:hypothetical protein n=1 Tax=Ilumatobacter sp. TaxID=1967498 RepID=UPI0032983067